MRRFVIILLLIGLPAVTVFLGYQGIKVPILTDLVGIVWMPISNLLQNGVGSIGSQPLAANVVGVARSTQSLADQLSSFSVGKGVLVFLLVIAAAIGRPLIHWLFRIGADETDKAIAAFHERREVVFTILEGLVSYAGIRLARDVVPLIAVAVVVYSVHYLGLVLTLMAKGQVENAIGSGGWLSAIINKSGTTLVDLAYQIVKILLPISLLFALVPQITGYANTFAITRPVATVSGSLTQIASGDSVVIIVGLALSVLRVLRDWQDKIWR